MADAAVEAAPGDENDDSWLYGESANDQITDQEKEGSEKGKEQTNITDGDAEGDDKEGDDNEQGNDDSHFNDEHFADVGRDGDDQNGDADSQNNGDTDSDDSDDIKVTIGDIKSGPQAYGLSIKRGGGLVAAGAAEKPRTGTTTGGKVTLEDLEGPGSINGVPALEFNIDTIEDKPWNKPGADISDYFNYGFNEITWSAYCERQRRMRVNEAGVGLHVGIMPRPPVPDIRRPPGRNDEMPPPMANNYQNRENTIQVMTAERREYGRSGHQREMGAPEYFGPPPTEHYFQPPPHQPYEEPWGHPEQTGWAPTEIKELTPGPMGPPSLVPTMMGQPNMAPPHMGAPPHMIQAPPYVPPYRQHPPPHMHDRDRDRERDRDRDRERDSRVRERDDRERSHRDRREEEERERERDRERDRSRSIKPDRVREKSYRRERSRSRSRRHKSRSRSPRPRERSRERERDRSRERERSRDRERSVKPKKDKEKEEEKQ